MAKKEPKVSPENDPMHVQSVSGIRHLAERLGILEEINQTLSEDCGCPICALPKKAK